MRRPVAAKGNKVEKADCETEVGLPGCLRDHDRPTWVKLGHGDIEKRFGRK